MKVAVLGLGIIGSEWAKHLDLDGVLAAAWNRTSKSHVPKFESDLIKSITSAEIIHICLADPGAVSEILGKISESLCSTHLVIQSSTIDPASSVEFKKIVSNNGAGYVEAPFTGSLPAAQKRELIFYLGVEEGLEQISRNYLSRLSKKIVKIGSEPQAATIKLCMNLQIASAMEALAEALSIARAAGISDQTFFESFKLNVSYSGVAALKEPKLLTKDFSPQFSVKHMAKDLRLLQSNSGANKFPFLDTLQEVFSRAQVQGYSDEDFCSLIKLIGS